MSINSDNPESEMIMLTSELKDKMENDEKNIILQLEKFFTNRFLLLCVRSFLPTSFFYKDNMPQDIFMTIVSHFFPLEEVLQDNSTLRQGPIYSTTIPKIINQINIFCPSLIVNNLLRHYPRCLSNLIFYCDITLLENFLENNYIHTVVSTLIARVFQILCTNGDVKKVEFIHKRLDNGIIEYHEENLTYAHPIKLAIEQGHINIVKYLLDNGVDVNQKVFGVLPLEQNLLLTSIEKRKNEITKLLIERGADVNYANNSYGLWTPLSLASCNGNDEIVEILIQKGADINPKSLIFETPIFEAVYNNHPDTVRLLLKKGACLSTDFIVIRTAVYHDRIEMMKLFLDIGIDINQKSPKSPRTTYLMEAVSQGNEDMVEFLIENGADVNYVDMDNRSALSIAKKKENSKIIGMIERASGPTPVYKKFKNEND